MLSRITRVHLTQNRRLMRKPLTRFSLARSSGLDGCKHPEVTCINLHELIRKYRCNSCGEVMKCACEEEFARLFFPSVELRNRVENTAESSGNYYLPGEYLQRLPGKARRGAPHGRDIRDVLESNQVLLA
jgi:hypothetical protein